MIWQVQKIEYIQFFRLGLQKWPHITQKLMELNKVLQNICDIIRDILMIFQSKTYSHSFWAEGVSHRKRQWTNVWISPSLLVDVVGDRGMCLRILWTTDDNTIDAIWYFDAICRINLKTRTYFQRNIFTPKNNDPVQIVLNNYFSTLQWGTESIT